nr:chitobiase/beta-hexosaminidase C-terminal domain-containing protein [Kiritimatiellia bacterium]
MKRQILKVIVLTLASAVAFSAARAAVGDVVASATSQKTWMDSASCKDATTVITVGENAEPVKVSYSGRTWYAGTAMGTSALYDNDVLVQNFTGEGWYEYVPPTAETHTLSLRIANGPTYQRTFLVEGPTLTITRGTDPTINGGISCAITSSAAGSTIYFTTDGTEPTTSSRVYTEPFAINPAMVTTVKAFCVAAGWPRSHTAMKLFMTAVNMELVASAGASTTSLDTRAGTGILEAKKTEKIVWSGLWAADANANVSVTLNGSPFASGKGDGVETWTSTAAGMYTFQHTTAGTDETLTAQFNVVAKDISLANVVVDCSDATYSGSAFMPAIQSAMWGEQPLVEGADYTLAYSGNINAGSATITLTGINLFNGAYTTNFTIKAKTLTSAMVESVGNVTYTGSAHKPEPTVTDSARGVTLVKGIDYTLSWGMNTAAGSGSVIVTGKGNYTGSATKNFTIAKAEVTPPTVASKAYTGGLLRANVSATARYTVQNDGGVNVGNYPVTLTLTDSANYRWKGGNSNPLSLTFAITKAANSWITQPSIAGWTYGQAANAPNLGAAKFGNVQVSYSATPQNAGSYTATFTVPETANYSALSKSVPFAIARATYDMSNARWSAGSFTYDGTQKSVIVEGLPSGVAVQSYANNAKTAAGNYTATVALNYDTTNFNAPSMPPCNWSIARKNIAGATVTLGPALVYNGAEQTQTVTGVKIGGLNATYTISGNKGTAAGSYTLTVTGTGNFTGTATVEFTISPKTLADTMVSMENVSYTYDGTAKTPTVTVVDGNPSILAASDYDIVYSGNVSAGTDTAKVTVTGKRNYTGAVTKRFSIAKATYNMSGAKWDYAGEFKYDGGQKTVLVTGLPTGVAVAAYSGNTGSVPGTYTAHAELLYDTANYNKPEIADLVWIIRSAEETKLEGIFDDLPADITPDGDGGWKVTITNDIDSADLPIEIPDDLGHVTIDLRGHDLIGADGAAGSETTPGGDGKSAIRVVAGDGSGGTVTRLTIITTGGDALVKGGDGGAGN